MLDLFHIAKPQGCDIQTFYGNGTVSNTANTKSWNKPRGVSNIYMLLIGAGGSGNASNGGGSGAVTVWYGSAVNVPDELEIHVGSAGNSSQIKYRTNSNTTNVLLLANTGQILNGGAATTANVFAASGFYQSIAGQNGSAASIAASSTTFLGGGGDISGTQNSNYGYSTGASATNRNGFFMLQPIIVGAGGMGSGNASIGCGGGILGVGGPGMVLIASW